jgi:hypothetical protein
LTSTVLPSTAPDWYDVDKKVALEKNGRNHLNVNHLSVHTSNCVLIFKLPGTDYGFLSMKKVALFSKNCLVRNTAKGIAEKSGYSNQIF